MLVVNNDDDDDDVSPPLCGVVVVIINAVEIAFVVTSTIEIEILKQITKHNKLTRVCSAHCCRCHCCYHQW